MNSHEIERIADAMHHLRPDWPIKQLKTLMTLPQLADRPRRDVTVALAWVACESGTANPYRVLEAGPWWRAVAIDGTTTTREVLTPAERCGICAHANHDGRCPKCPAIDDHIGEPDFKTKRDGGTVHQIVESIKAEVAPTSPSPEPRSLDDLAADPRVEAARAAMTTTALSEERTA